MPRWSLFVLSLAGCSGGLKAFNLPEGVVDADDTDDPSQDDPSTDEDPDVASDEECPETGEPNEDVGSAVELPETGDLALTAGDVDTWSFTVSAGHDATVRVLLDSGDADLTVLDVLGTQVGSSATSSGTEEVSFTHVSAVDGRYHAVVEHVKGACVRYTVEIETTAPPAEDCADGDDNDRDGDADCDDSDCASYVECLPCVEDGYEPNDSRNDAISLQSGTDLAVQQDAPDWFSFEVPSGQYGTAKVTFDPADGDVDLKLYDDAGNLLDESLRPNAASEEVTAPNGSASAVTLYAKVLRYDGDSCIPYDYAVSYSALPAEDCGDDADNDFDAAIDCWDTDCTADPGCASCLPDASEDADDLASAASLTSGTGLTSVSGDPDWYAFTLEDGKWADVEVSYDPSEGDVDLYLYDEDGLLLTSSVNGATKERGSVYNISGAAVTVYAVVQMYTEDACGTYDYEVTFTDVPDEDCADEADNDYDGDIDCGDGDCLLDAACASCLSDAHEPNDDQAGATPLTSESGLTVVSGNDDWFSFELPDQKWADVTVAFDSGEGDVDLYLLDASGITLDYGFYGNDSEVVSAYNVSGAAVTLWADVRMYDTDACATYDFTVSITDLPGEDCADGDDNDFDGDEDCWDPDCLGDAGCQAECPEDTYEANDTLADAFEVFDEQDLLVHTYSEDWFLVEIPPGQRAVVDVDAEVTVALELDDEAGNALVSGIDDLTQQSVENMTQDAVTRYVHVSNPDGLCALYDLGIQVGPVCVEDGLGSSSFKKPLDLQAQLDATVFYGTDDWYGQTLYPGESLDVEVTFDHDMGDIDVLLYDEDMDLLDASFSSTDAESVGITLSASAWFEENVYIEVYNPFETTCNDYSLEAVLY